MSYKKPQIVAKSAAKQSFVAGCPTNQAIYYFCNASGSGNRSCENVRAR